MIEFYRQTKPTQTTVSMSNHTFLSSFWEGFHIVKSHQAASLIELTLKLNSIARCPCGLKAQAIHKYQWRNVKEATLLGPPVELTVQPDASSAATAELKQNDYLDWNFMLVSLTVYEAI